MKSKYFITSAFFILSVACPTLSEADPYSLRDIETAYLKVGLMRNKFGSTSINLSDSTYQTNFSTFRNAVPIGDKSSAFYYAKKLFGWGPEESQEFHDILFAPFLEEKKK